MALILKDRVLETSQTSGTGTIALSGAVNGFQTFSSAIGNTNTTYYAIVDDADNQWEVGLGTVGAGTLTRDTVYSSSNGGSKVNFGTSIKNVFCDYPASKSVNLDANGKVLFGGNTYEDFTSTTAPSYSEGRVWYDSTEKALAFYNDSSSLAVHVSQDLIFKVINNTGSTIPNGSPVYITSTSTGQSYPNVALAKADVAATSAVIGLTNGAIANGATGYVSSQGTIDNVNTSTFTVGQVLYLSPYSAGQLMNTIPPTGITVQVGVATYIDSSAGHIYVKQTTPLAVPASIVTGTLGVDHGGTGQSSALVAGAVVYGSSTTAMGVTAAGTSGQVLTSAGTGTPTWTTPTTGTVTSVGGTGTVSGISLSGTVTSSGNLTLGGTLDLSSPPAIGATTPAAGTFTTLTSSGTATLANGSTTYVTVTGDASYPMIKATGGTNTPLVLSPLGTGALQAQKTDSTATGGNARGQYAVDWQTSRNGAAQVASSTQSVVGGGFGNTASNVASTVAGGASNVVNQPYGGILSGQSNAVTLNYASVVGGSSNTGSGYYGFVGGGTSNSTTSSSAVTTQSGTMNATTAVTLSGSNASIKVGQMVTGTSISFPNTYVAAISGTSLTLSQAASGSSTSTLSFYTPHGVVVGGGNNQATGSYSFIGGGGDAGTAANRNVASGDWSTVCGGRGNTASGIASFVGGGGTNGASLFNNTASGTWSVAVGGLTSSATGVGSFVGGGYINTASGQYSSIVSGARGTTRAINGNFVFSPVVPIADASGVSQAALLVLGVQTTDATATVLRSDSSAAGTTNQVILPNNSAYYFTGEVISGVTAGGDSKGWSISGVIKRGANAAATTLVGSTVTSLYADAGATTWTIGLTADTTNGGLKVTFTGQASTTIRTVCQIRTTEMTY